MSDSSDGPGDGGRRDSFERYRDRLAALGFRPQRRFGQNFLLDRGCHEAVADAAGVGTADLVLEVGGGLGFLTRVLAERAAAVVCVEVDPRLARVLTEDLRRLPDDRGARVELVHSDVLGGASGGLAEPVVSALSRHRPALVARGGGLRVAANLPYAISGPFLAELLAAPLPDLPLGMGLLVQKEFADRLAAAPGEPDYGALSALAQAFYTVRRGRSVSRGAFRPRPNVDSAIAILAREDRPPVLADPAERGAFARFLRTVFAQRRKVLRHGLSRAERDFGLRFPATEAERGSRAEQLGAARWLELWLAREPIR